MHEVGLCPTSSWGSERDWGDAKLNRYVHTIGAQWGMRLRPRRTAPANVVPVRIAMTSFPARIGMVNRAIESILLQSVAAAHVTLYLAATQFPQGEPGLPRRLQYLAATRLDLDVVFVADDERSYKKLLPELRLGHNMAVLTVDDDVIYPRHFLRDIWAAHLRFPEAILGSRGTYIESDSNGSVSPYLSWSPAPLMKPSRRIFLTGRGGILYPVHSLDIEVMNHSRARELCPTSDDTWFKVMSLRAGRSCVRVGDGTEFADAGLRSRAPLHAVNVASGENDRALLKCLQEFGPVELEDV